MPKINDALSWSIHGHAQAETVKRVSRTSTSTAATVHPCLLLSKEAMFWLAD